MEGGGLHFFLVFLPPNLSPFLPATQTILILKVSKACAVDTVVWSPLEYILLYLFSLSPFIKKDLPDRG